MSHIPGQYLSRILLLKNKDGKNRPYINLKALNKLIRYKHFKMEGLHGLKYFLEENDFFFKIDLSERYLFLSSHVHELKKVCETCLAEKSL